MDKYKFVYSRLYCMIPFRLNTLRLLILSCSNSIYTIRLLIYSCYNSLYTYTLYIYTYVCSVSMSIYTYVLGNGTHKVRCSNRNGTRPLSITGLLEFVKRGWYNLFLRRKSQPVGDDRQANRAVYGHISCKTSVNTKSCADRLITSNDSLLGNGHSLSEEYKYLNLFKR